MNLGLYTITNYTAAILVNKKNASTFRSKTNKLKCKPHHEIKQFVKIYKWKLPRLGWNRRHNTWILHRLGYVTIRYNLPARVIYRDVGARDPVAVNKAQGLVEANADLGQVAGLGLVVVDTMNRRILL